MKGASIVLATLERHQYVFLAKQSSKKASKVKKADSQISLASDSIMCSRILNDQTISTISGNSFSMSKVNIDLFDGGNVRKHIELGVQV